MFLSDDDSAKLKQWIVNRLEDISDADSDVLADYVLALVKAEEPDDQVRANCLENLEDFLQEHTASFVNDVFATIQSINDPPSATLNAPSQALPTQQSAILSPPTGPRSTNGAGQQSRKRARQDNDDSSQRDSHYRNGPDGRRTKQARGGLRNGRGGMMGQNGGFHMPPGMPQLPAQVYGGQNPHEMGGMPGLPNFGDPAATMMALQAMGFPIGVPGMPGMQMPTPTRQGRFPSGKEKRKGRCRNYDAKGFCERGSTCPYEHVNVPAASDGNEEYDPANATMSLEPPGRTRGPGHRAKNSGRGSHKGRGRAPFSGRGPTFDKSNTTIVVEQIPEENFSEEQVRDFFGQHGTIQTVDLKPQQQIAVVEFADHDSAQAARDSPKAIFDNRFVKVYWYAPNQQQSTKAGHANGKQHPQASDEMAIDPVEFEKRQQEAQKAYEERTKQREEAARTREEIEEKIQKHAKERQALMKKLAAATEQSSEEIAEGQLSATVNGTNNVAPSSGKSSAQTEALRATLAQLEAQAVSMGLNPDEADSTSVRGRGGFRGRGRGRGYGESFYRGGRGGFGTRGAFGQRGRGMWRGSSVMRLDNRPKRVAVMGIKEGSQADEGLRAFLFNNYEFDSIEPHHERDDAQIVAFKERYMAEKFMEEHKSEPTLSAVETAWVANAPAPSADAAVSSETSAPKPFDTDMADAGEVSAAGNHEGPEQEHKDEKVEVDYDVADDDDRW